jgi:hypothetical protein
VPGGAKKSARGDLAGPPLDRLAPKVRHRRQRALLERFRPPRLVVVFLLFDGLIKLAKSQPVVEATDRRGFPRTPMLGAVLLTGDLGGAIATHVGLADPLLSRTLFRSFRRAGVGGFYFPDARA